MSEYKVPADAVKQLLRLRDNLLDEEHAARGRDADDKASGLGLAIDRLNKLLDSWQLCSTTPPTPLPVVDETDRVCENCRSWHRHQDDRLGLGQCRKNPPQFVAPHRDWDGTAASYLYQCSEWPITADGDWCVAGWEPKSDR